MTTTIVVSPLGRQLEDTGEVIRLDILVNDPAFFEAYQRIEVWRSVLGEGGPYNELTAMDWSPALIPEGSDPVPTAGPGPNVVIVGDELKVLVNEQDEVTVSFTGVDPLSYFAVAGQISAQGQNKVLAHVTELGALVLSTTGIGTGASLRVKQTDGAAKLGLPIDQVSYGRDPWPHLVPGLNRYSFEDKFGRADYNYKIRFRSLQNAVSEFSLPHSIGSRVGIDSSQLICGKADLVQGNGKPLINQQVQLHNEFNGTLVDGKLMVGCDITKMTDAHGHVEFMLVRGQKFTVGVPGTSLYRTITVPTDPAKDTFNLFDPDIADEDLFKVQVPEIISAERRTL